MGMIPDPTPHERAQLARFTELAILLEKAVEPIVFRVAETDEERRATFRLRYDVSVESGWVDPARFPTGEERDEYDDDAIHVAGWDGDEIVATGRIVLPKPGRLLPTEAQFNVRAEPAGAVVDVGRSIVVAGHRDPSHGMMFALMGRLWREIDQLDYHLACGCTVERIHQIYRTAGFDATIIGEARSYWGAERLPFQINLARSADEVISRIGG
jgi:N-acyl-L-homoserine lactone synthetase